MQNYEEERVLYQKTIPHKHEPFHNDPEKGCKNPSLLWGNQNIGMEHGTDVHIRFQQWLEPMLLQTKSAIFKTQRCSPFQEMDGTVTQRSEPCVTVLLT